MIAFCKKNQVVIKKNQHLITISITLLSWFLNIWELEVVKRFILLYSAIRSLKITHQLIYVDHNQVVIAGQNRFLYNIYSAPSSSEENEPS